VKKILENCPAVKLHFPFNRAIKLIIAKNLVYSIMAEKLGGFWPNAKLSPVYIS
jgi:hypothetical protein